MTEAFHAVLAASERERQDLFIGSATGWVLPSRISKRIHGAEEVDSNQNRSKKDRERNIKGCFTGGSVSVFWDGVSGQCRPTAESPNVF
jgi:hypothetical protein